MSKDKIHELKTGQLHLHDEVATKLLLQGDVLTFELKYYDGDRQVYLPYSVIFYGVTGMKIDHAPVANIVPPTDNGDVLRYKESNGKASLLIEWHDFKTKNRITKLYEFGFGHRHIKNDSSPS